MTEHDGDRAEPSGDPSWREVDRRPDGVSDATVEATGKLSEALEWIERARGRRYDFHQLSGHADLLLGEAAEAFAAAGHAEWAERIDTDLVGRNVIEGRWTFQIVEEYDATYWSEVRSTVRAVERDLVGGSMHVHESEMKGRRRTRDSRHHEQRPEPAG